MNVETATEFVRVVHPVLVTKFTVDINSLSKSSRPLMFYRGDCHFGFTSWSIEGVHTEADVTFLFTEIFTEIISILDDLRMLCIYDCVALRWLLTLFDAIANQAAKFQKFKTEETKKTVLFNRCKLVFNGAMNAVSHAILQRSKFGAHKKLWSMFHLYKGCYRSCDEFVQSSDLVLYCIWNVRCKSGYFYIGCTTRGFLPRMKEHWSKLYSGTTQSDLPCYRYIRCKAPHSWVCSVVAFFEANVF
jgi:hypothetical protein